MNLLAKRAASCHLEMFLQPTKPLKDGPKKLGAKTLPYRKSTTRFKVVVLNNNRCERLNKNMNRGKK